MSHDPVIRAALTALATAALAWCLAYFAGRWSGMSPREAASWLWRRWL